MATSAHRLLTGKPRTYGGGKRAWRATLYAPSGRYKLYRVTFKEEDPDTGTWDWTNRTASTEDEARDLFRQVEASLDAHTAAPARARVQTARTIEALGELYLAESRAQHQQARTIEQRESKLRAHINPTIGSLPVTKWRVEHNRAVMAKACQTVKSYQGRQDVRSVLSAMRSLAWREGWLDRSIDPLEGLKLEKPDLEHGTGEGYVPLELRPSRHMVEAMARAADHLVVTGPETLRRLPLFGQKIRLAGYCGLRLGEQNGLRAVDIFFERGVIDVNGAWVQPRGTDASPFRGPVKNRKRHDVPAPASWLRALLPRCAVLLGLPADATEQQVINAQRAERLRRGKLIGKPQLWWKAEVDPAEELWLFIDTETGLPVRSETHNDRWHKVRRWVAKNDPENEWPEFIVYRNLRHHAATFWHDELNRDWVDVAAFLGDTLPTVLKHYVRPGVEAVTETVKLLEDW